MAETLKQWNIVFINYFLCMCTYTYTLPQCIALCMQSCIHWTILQTVDLHSHTYKLYAYIITCNAADEEYTYCRQRVKRKLPKPGFTFWKNNVFRQSQWCYRLRIYMAAYLNAKCYSPHSSCASMGYTRTAIIRGMFLTKYIYRKQDLS